LLEYFNTEFNVIEEKFDLLSRHIK
jgi:hypothetical protein